MRRPRSCFGGYRNLTHTSFTTATKPLKRPGGGNRPGAELYRVILQVGIAYYQIERANYWGAHKMFMRPCSGFAPIPDRCQGIDVGATAR